MGRPCGFCSNFGSPWLFWNHHWLKASEWRALIFSLTMCSIRGYGTDFIEAKPGLCGELQFARVRRFLSTHLQMGDDRSFWSLTKPYLSKCSQEMRRSCHPPRVCSNTLLSQQNMAEELCPKDYHRARLESRDGLTKSLPLHPFLLFTKLGIGMDKNRSRHMSRCKPLLISI